MKEAQRATARQERLEVDYEVDAITDSDYLLRCLTLIFQHACFLLLALNA